MPGKEVRHILSQFGISGADIRVERLTHGLINDSYKVFSEGEPIYVLQRINHSVFPTPVLLMENIIRVLPALEAEDYTAVSLLETTKGDPWFEAEEGDVWRILRYVPNSYTQLATEDPQTAGEAGRVIGRFHQLVSDMQPSKLHVTLEGFHDLELRTRQLEDALRGGVPGRIQKADALLELCGKLTGLCAEIPLNTLPLRVCHNDTKLSNILFDKGSGRGLCLIDLDTLMPGHLLYDFGDAARTLLNPVAETLARNRKSKIVLSMFEAFAKGWRASGLEMEAAEASWICHGVLLMPTLHGIRALTDYLSGDRYYRTTYPEQNLDRATGMLEFASLVAKRLPEMQEVFAKGCSS